MALSENVVGLMSRAGLDLAEECVCVEGPSSDSLELFKDETQTALFKDTVRTAL